MTAADSGRVVVAVYSERDGYAAPKHSAVVHFGSSPHVLVADRNVSGRPILDGQEVYRHHLFQRGEFQRIEALQELSAKACRVDLAHRPHDGDLGDPFTLDGVLQAAQLCLAGNAYLLVHIGQIEVTPLFFAPSSATVRASVKVTARDGDRVHLDAMVVDDRGPLLARLTDLSGGKGRQCRCGTAIGCRDHDGNRVARVTAGPFDTSNRVSRGAGPVGEGDQSATGRDGRSAGASATARVEFLDDRPVVTGANGFGTSVAHDGDLLLLAAGTSPVGCDVVAVTPRPASRWCAMLGLLADGARELFAGGVPFDLAAAMVWAMHECVLKATGVSPATCAVVEQQRHHAVLRGPSTGVTVSTHVATADSATFILPVTLSGGEGPS